MVNVLGWAGLIFFSLVVIFVVFVLTVAALDIRDEYRRRRSARARFDWDDEFEGFP